MAVEHGTGANQLQFSTCPSVNATTRFYAPHPIIIETIGLSSTPPERVIGQAGIVNFSSVSHDSLALAVDLAKRDLKQKNEKEEIRQIKRQSSPSRYRNSTKITLSRNYKNKLHRREWNSSPMVLNIRERTGDKIFTKNTKSQTSRVVDQANANYFKHDRDLASLPVRSMSPPTRDEVKTSHLSHEEKVLSEICRLRKEMMKCLQQIKMITVQRDFSSPKTEMIYNEDIEDERKRQTRAEERATRSARTIYMLTCQSNELQEEVKKLDKSKMDFKKSRLISRLAMLHRGVVKALQMLVHQMSDVGIHKSIPRGYHDLAIIIRQLSISCAQLEVTTEAVATDDIMALLKDIVELNKIVDKEPSSASYAVAKSPSRLCQSTKSSENRSRNNSTSYYALPDLDPSIASHDPVEKVRLTHDQTKATISKIVSSPVKLRQKSRRSPWTIMHDDVTTSGEEAKDRNRHFVLNDGLKRLLEVRGQIGKESVIENDHIKAKQKTSKRNIKPCCVENHHHSKGVLISERHNRILPVDSRKTTVIKRTNYPSMTLSDFHFAESTFSKLQKEVSSPLNSNRSRSSTPQITPRQSLSVLDERELLSPQQEDYILHRNMEKRKKYRLNPLIERNQAVMDVDNVTDMIMGDVLDDVAEELNQRKIQNSLDYQTSLMTERVDVDTILHRLHQMEMEQNEIRRRWASLSYEDDRHVLGADLGYTHPDSPESPLYAEFASGSNIDKHYCQTQKINFQPTATEEPIVFTKSGFKEKSFFTSQFEDLEHKQDAGIILTMSKESIANIKRQVFDFNGYLLRQIGDGINDRFDPWKVVDIISDEILENCIADVCHELEEINNDLIDHVYETEFAAVPTNKNLNSEQDSG